MFLHILDEAEQRLFARVARQMVHVDDHLDPREEALLEALHLEMGLEELPTGTLEPETDGLLELTGIESRVVARVFAFELAGIVTADGEIHADERSLLADASRQLGIAEEEVGRFLDFAMRAHQFWNEARELIAEGTDH